MRGGGGSDSACAEGLSSGSWSERISTTSAWGTFRRGRLIGEVCFSSSKVANGQVTGGDTGRSGFFTVALGRLARLASALLLIEGFLCGFVSAGSVFCD